MKKEEFLIELEKALSGLPQDEIEERITFYSEMIDDRIEDGLSEEEAISSIGPIDEIVNQIVVETPLVKIAKERIKPKRQLMAWEIILLIIGAPLWFPLLIAFASIIFALYIVLWSIIFTFWIVFLALGFASFACAVAGFVLPFGKGLLIGITSLASGMVLAGITILLFFVSKIVTKAIIIATKKIAIWIKGCFIKKEKA